MLMTAHNYSCILRCCYYLFHVYFYTHINKVDYTIGLHIRLVTGSIVRSANLPVFNLLRGRFWGFSPRSGDTLHRWRWNLAWWRGPKGGDLWFPPPCQISPHRCNNKGVGPPKLKLLLRFDQNVEYKRPARAYPLRDFHKLCTVFTSF